MNVLTNIHYTYLSNRLHFYAQGVTSKKYFVPKTIIAS